MGEAGNRRSDGSPDKRPKPVSRYQMIAGLALGLLGFSLGAASALADWEVPKDLEPVVNGLPEAQQAFIRSGRALDFIPEGQLSHELSTRETEQLQTMLGDIMSLAQQMTYDDSRDMGAAPLNLTSKRFGAPVPTLGPLRDEDRDAGPFSVHRYLFPESGVPTFGGAPVAIWPEDLMAGAVDIAMVGVPSDMSSGRRDAANAPGAMREMQTLAERDARSLLAPFEVLKIVDYGNFAVDNLSAELTAKHVARMVAEVAATGTVPVIVGGDGMLLHPVIQGVVSAHGDAALGLLHLSAHPAVDDNDTHTLSDKSAFHVVLNDGLIEGSDAVLLGLRGSGVTPDSLRYLRAESVRYHTMVEWHDRGGEKVLKEVFKEVNRLPDRLFLSVDVSVLDPAEMIAAGRMVNNGIPLAEVTRVLRTVCATKEIAGFEITDLAPMLDVSRQAVANANAMVNACLNGMALRKAGRSPDYVHPLVADHGQR